MVPFEDVNVEAYTLLLRIETAIRELLREHLAAKYGDLWRRRIPGELLQKIREAERLENRPQFNFLHLGPLYYLTMGELLPLLEQRDGRDAVACIGGDRFTEQAKNLLVVRNAVAHGRSVSRSALAFLKALYAQIDTALGARLALLLANPDVGHYPDEIIPELLRYLMAARKSLVELSVDCPMGELFQVARHQYWWGVEDLAGFDCSVVERAVGVIERYNSFPQGIGAAAIRQRFLEDDRGIATIDAALEALRKGQSRG